MEPECRQGPAAFPRRPENIQLSATDLLHEMKDNHVLYGIVRCSTNLPLTYIYIITYDIQCTQNKAAQSAVTDQSVR